MIYFAKTPNNAEQVVNMVASSQKYVVYTLPLPDISAGDLVEIRAQGEITNPNANPFMVGCFLMIGSSPTDTSPDIMVTRARAENCTGYTEMHHQRIDDAGSFIAAADLVGKHANWILYCGRVGEENKTIRVEQNYGGLEVKVTPASMLV